LKLQAEQVVLKPSPSLLNNSEVPCSVNESAESDLPLTSFCLRGELESRLLSCLAVFSLCKYCQVLLFAFDLRNLRGLDLVLLLLLALLGVAEAAVLVKYNMSLVVKEVSLFDHCLIQNG
jgi:hypothetical protein